MPRNSTWLDKVMGAISSFDAMTSLGNIQRATDEMGEKYPWAMPLTKPLSLGIDAASTIGRPIAAAGGALGALGSEAANEARSREAAKMALEGAKQGWLEGDETFKDTIGALDVASLVTGGMAGAASKAAALSGSTKALKTAKALNALDLGLSAADAGIGGANVYEGVRDKDLAKLGMGAFRIAGNAYGGLKAKQALDELGIPTMAEARARERTHKRPSEAVRILEEDNGLDAIEREAKRKNIMDVGYANRFRDEDYTVKEHTDILADKRGPGGRWEDVNHHLIRNRQGEPDAEMNTRHHQPDAAGEDFTIEVVDDAIGLRTLTEPDKAMTPQRIAADRMKDNPVLSRFALWVRQAVAEGQNELVGKMSTAIDEINPAGTNPLTSFSRWKQFRGVVVGALSDGWTYLDPKTKGNYPYADNRAFYLNPRESAMRISERWDTLMDPQHANTIDTKQLLQSMSPEAQEYVKSVWAGGARSPELDLKFKAERFIYETLYTTLHESGSHSRPDSDHMNSMYRKSAGGQARVENGKLVWPKVGEIFEPVRLKYLDPDKASSFDPMHNTVLQAMSDPSALRITKSLPTRDQIDFFKLFSGEDPELDTAVKRYRDRVNSRAEHKKAMQGEEIGQRGMVANKPRSPYEEAMRNESGMNETPNQLDIDPDAPIPDWVREAQARGGQPPTPPGSVPPGSSGGPIGPQLQPLSKRIKDALTEHQRAVNQNAMKMSEVNKVRAELLRQNEEALLSQKIDSEEFTRESKKIMSGGYDLIGKVDPLVLEGGDAPDFMQKIAAQSNDDAFKRQRAQIAFDKMVKGNRLETNEIQLMREVLNERVEAVAANPLNKRLGEFFANTTGGLRALLTAYDLSAAGRQALYGSVLNPGAAKEAFKAQIQALKMTRPEFDSMMMRLQDPQFNPYAEIAKAAGLHFSESATKATAETAEEAFMHGKWAEKLPGVKQTEQAYIAYLNKLRVELFNKHVKVLNDAGTPLLDEDMGVTQVVKDLAYMVNTLTGRGEMSLFHMSPNSAMGKKLGLTETWAPGKGAMDKAHEALTSVFFAPRFAASRASLMRDTVQAMLGGGLDPTISKIYMKNVIGTISAMTAVAGGLAAMGVGTFNTDPRKKDFGVLKVGKTRYDLYGGLKPWAKITAMIGADDYYSGRSRVPKKYSSGPMTKTKTGELGRFAQSKLSPLAGFIVEAMTGEDFMGRKSSVWQNAYGHAVPMIAQTIVDLYNEDELDQLPFAVPASIVGLGVNTYSERRFNQRNR